LDIWTPIFIKKIIKINHHHYQPIKNHHHTWVKHVNPLSLFHFHLLSYTHQLSLESSSQNTMKKPFSIQFLKISPQNKTLSNYKLSFLLQLITHNKSGSIILYFMSLFATTKCWAATDNVGDTMGRWQRWTQF
jgi:Na+/melibiose symporter-like transporter